MKVQPIAFNHILLFLDNGEILDINDGTGVPKGALTIKLSTPTKRQLIVSTSTTYDGAVRLLMEEG